MPLLLVRVDEVTPLDELSSDVVRISDSTLIVACVLSLVGALAGIVGWTMVPVLIAGAMIGTGMYRRVVSFIPIRTITCNVPIGMVSLELVPTGRRSL